MKMTCFSRWFFAMAMLAGGGCSTTYSIRPDPKSITLPAHRTTPLPIKVAVVRVEQVRGDFAAELLKGFEEVGLFEAVYYPVRSNDPFDATMEITQKSSGSTSWGRVWEPSLNIVSLGLSRLFLRYAEECHIEASITLRRAAGTVHTFSTNATVVVKWKAGTMFDQRMDSDIGKAASKLLQARLIEMIASDPQVLEANTNKGVLLPRRGIDGSFSAGARRSESVFLGPVAAPERPAEP